MSLKERVAQPPPLWPRFSAAVRGPVLTAHIGRILGIGFALCFVTGLYSHYQYGPAAWAPIWSSPSWGYRLTQGVHVITGIALIPLTLFKLWSVFPRLFGWPAFTSLKTALERLSIALLVSAALVELVTGFLNILTWYPWPWNFVQVHFWLAFVVIGSILLHLAVKWPVIIRALRTKLAAPADGPGTVAADSGSLKGVTLPTWVPDVKPGGITRRGAFLAGAAGVGLGVLTTVGQSFSPLESVALLAPRRPSDGPLGVPINRTAVEAKVTKTAVLPNYALVVEGPDGQILLNDEAMLTMATIEESWPIACVEGWSAAATWRGFRLLDLVKQVGATSSSIIEITSLQEDGPFRSSLVEGPHLESALLATHLNGVRLPVDHGYPVRLIAPNRAGVLNTKWIKSVKVQ